MLILGRAIGGQVISSMLCGAVDLTPSKRATIQIHVSKRRLTSGLPPIVFDAASVGSGSSRSCGGAETCLGTEAQVPARTAHSRLWRRPSKLRCGFCISAIQAARSISIRATSGSRDRVLSDQFELVSARTVTLPLMPRRVDATQRERRRGWY